MKSTILFLFVFVLTLSSFAQVPQKFNYQAVVRNNTGVIIANQKISIKIEVLQIDSNQTSVLYAETHTPTTNTYGLFNIQIGGGSLISGNLSSMNWGTGNKYLRTSVDLTGGNNYVTMGTSPLVSVPYAQYATKADTALYIKGVSDQYRRLQSQLYIKN
jgi:hypothetical protein